MAILEARGLSKYFGGVRALHEVDIDIQQGEILGLIGPNGAGKTTWLNVVTGFLEPTAGSIEFNGQSIAGLNPPEIAKMGIIRTFQLTSLFPNLTVEENIITGSYLKTSGTLWGSFFTTKGYRTEEMKLKQKAIEILSFLGMGKSRDVLAKNLAGGDQRKLEIAIALAAEPQLLFLDEPAAGLTITEAVDLVSMLQSIQKTGINIVIIEHNMRVIMGLCTRIVVLDYGVKIAEGTPKQIANDEMVKSIYLGTRKNV